MFMIFFEPTWLTLPGDDVSSQELSPLTVFLIKVSASKVGWPVNSYKNS